MTTPSTQTGGLFFQDLGRFGDAPVTIDAASGAVTSYAQFEALVTARIPALGTQRALVFMEAKNKLSSLVDYVACLRGGHVIYLLEDLSSAKMQELLELYRPNILIDGGGAVIQFNDQPIALHPDLLLLLSTSGSTGSPKFVKLSARNLDSNAQSIAQYLELAPGERALQHLKPHYSYGLSIINSHLACGGALVLTDATVMEDEFWQHFEAFKATSFAGVPYTFETLLHRKFKSADHPNLRYVTQAGGKLHADIVKTFAEEMTSVGKRFYVMYGQTEAAPRVAYLPPDLAVAHPGSTGRAIPGGTLYLIDETGARLDQTGTPGELVYEGPNIMMGYATRPEELATEETPPCLKTGDIAIVDEQGLFSIVGRSSRFVKPFGVRVNLDELQSYVKGHYATVAVTGDDNHIVIAVETDQKDGSGLIDVPALTERFGMPAHVFHIKTYAALPLLSSGKYDFQRILKDDGIVAKKSLLQRSIDSVFELLGLNEQEWDSVQDMYRSVLGNAAITENDSFGDLTVDSLSFVALAIELEDLLKEKLPENWQELPIRELEARYRAVEFG